MGCNTLTCACIQAAANGNPDDAKELLSDVAALGITGVKIKDLVVPIVIELPLPGCVRPPLVLPVFCVLWLALPSAEE